VIWLERLGLQDAFGVLRPKPRFASILLLLGLGAGCNGCGQKGIGDKPSPTPAASATAAPLPPGRTMVDLIEKLSDCDIEHRGILFDAGTPSMTGRFAWTGTAPSGIENVEHDASTWMRSSYFSSCPKPIKFSYQREPWASFPSLLRFYWTINRWAR
jgi:hypothetical protein